MLSPEERQIAEYGKAQGKSREEVMVAISKFRTGTTQKPTETATPEAGIGQRVSDVVNNAGQTVRQNILGEGEFADQSAVRRGTQAVAAAATAVPQTVLAAAPKPVRGAVEQIGKIVGKGFKFLTDKIADTELFKGAAGNLVVGKDGTVSYVPNDLGVLEEGLGTVGALGETAGNMLGAQGTVRTLTKGVDLTKSGVQKLDEGMTKTKAALTPTAEQIALERKSKIEQGLNEQNTRLKSADKSFTKNTITRQTKDGKKVTITPIDTFSKHGIAPVIDKGSIQMGDYRTGTGELGKIKAKVSDLDTQIESKMKGNTTPIDLSEMEFKAFENVMKNEDFKLSGTVGAQVAKLEAKFKDFKATYGTTITAEEVNKMRKNANYDFDPETQDISRVIGDTARQYVYKASPEAQGLLQKQGELLSAKKYAETLNGTKVTGGRLGNMAMRTAGAVAGSTIQGVPVVGPLVGMVGGEFAARALQQSQFKSLWTELRAKLVKDQSNSLEPSQTAKTIPNIDNIKSTVPSRKTPSRGVMHRDDIEYLTRVAYENPKNIKPATLQRVREILSNGYKMEVPKSDKALIDFVTMLVENQTNLK